MNDEIRWQIFKILRFPDSLRVALWAKIATRETDAAWLAQVIAIVDRLVAADENPATLVGSTDEYEPGLKKLDVIEYYQGVAETAYKEIYDRLWQDLAILIGRVELFATLDDDSSATIGSGWGFS